MRRYTWRERQKHALELLRKEFAPFQSFQNARWVQIIQFRQYRFCWQTTTAHWFIVSIDWSRCRMRSKHGKEIVWNVDDITGRSMTSVMESKKKHFR